MHEPTSISPARLFAVADLVLELIDANDGSLNLLDLSDSSLGEPGFQPTSLPNQSELNEAVSFLVRLGFIKEADRSGSK